MTMTSILIVFFAQHNAKNVHLQGVNIPVAWRYQIHPLRQ